MAPALSPGQAPPSAPNGWVSQQGQNAGQGAAQVGLTLSEVRGVCVAFNSGTLDEAPLWTRLDDPAGPFVVSGYQIDRGRSYELDQTSPGTATVTIIDRAGAFDPTNTFGPFYGKLDPMKQAAIALRNPVTGNWRTIFRGFVSKWSYDLYQTENYNTVTLELVDGMDVLTAAEMQFLSTIGTIWGDAVPADSAGDIFYAADDQVADRINHVLNDAGWPTGLREIFSGNVSVLRTVYAVRSQALSAIQDAADAEFPGVSNFYMSSDGKATFHGRLARFHPTDANYHISQWKAGDISGVFFDSDRALIFGLDWDRDKDKIINEAIATPQNIVSDDIPLQFVADETSVAKYGSRGVSFENLLTHTGLGTGNGANDETRLYATYYVDNYANPRTRINSITFKRLGPTSPYAAAIWRLMCNVDISDIINVNTTHGGGGGFNEDFYVEGLHYTVGPLASNYLDVELTIDLSPKAYYDTNPFG